MKTLLAGVLLGIAAKCLWDSEYADQFKEKANSWWNGMLDTMDKKMEKAENVVEKIATKLNDTANSF